jgi:hypothetical protein
VRSGNVELLQSGGGELLSGPAVQTIRESKAGEDGIGPNHLTI